MENALFVILGATGDLSQRKLIPAIYHLVKSKHIDNFAIIGTGRKKISKNALLKRSEKHIKDIDKKVWAKVKKAFYFHHLSFYEREDYKLLTPFIESIEENHKTGGNRIFYLATLPDHFEAISKNLSECKVAKRNKGWSRVVYEKPFGESLKSAKKINKYIRKVFSEKQIYRIDHYLGKELVNNIALIRFTNSILEPLWSRKHIEHVQIIISEKIGVKSRGDFYDKYGALRDVFQNHALQLLALTAMEAPKSLSGKYIRNEKAAVLRNTRVKDFMIGQYKGYKQEKGVKKNSKTETFATIHACIDNIRWRGVPFFIKLGKGLDKKETTIHIKFKKVNCLLSKTCPSDSNYLTIRIQPDDGFSFEINSKVPGKDDLVKAVKMDFCESCLFGPNTPQAYEVLLEDVLLGDQSNFVRKDEIEYAWKVTDSVQKRKRGKKLYTYKKGSKGPKGDRNWRRKHHLQWKS